MDGAIVGGSKLLKLDPEELLDLSPEGENGIIGGCWLKPPLPPEEDGGIAEDWGDIEVGALNPLSGTEGDASARYFTLAK